MKYVLSEVPPSSWLLGNRHGLISRAQAEGKMQGHCCQGEEIQDLTAYEAMHLSLPPHFRRLTGLICPPSKSGFEVDESRGHVPCQIGLWRYPV